MEFALEKGYRPSSLNHLASADKRSGLGSTEEIHLEFERRCELMTAWAAFAIGTEDNKRY